MRRSGSAERTEGKKEGEERRGEDGGPFLFVRRELVIQPVLNYSGNDPADAYCTFLSRDAEGRRSSAVRALIVYSGYTASSSYSRAEAVCPLARVPIAASEQQLSDTSGVAVVSKTRDRGHPSTDPWLPRELMVNS